MKKIEPKIDHTSIQVSRVFQKFVLSMGKKGESYEDIIRRLINGDKPDDMMVELRKMIIPVISGICKGSGRVTKADMERLFGA